MEELVDSLFLTTLSRFPEPDEVGAFVGLLTPGFGTRIVPGTEADPPAWDLPARRVSWSNHLSPEANAITVEHQRLIQCGPSPTRRLTPAWRERCEDALWAFINSPEFVFLP